MNPMLERVARALCVAAGMDPDRPSNDERDAGKPLWMTYVGMARAAEEARGDWQPIETAPKDGCLIFAWAPGDLPYVSTWAGDRWAYNTSRRRSLMWPQPTHWMPLPEPTTLGKGLYGNINPNNQGGSSGQNK